MRTVVVGAGPVGIVAGVALSRRGHDVVLVEKDEGPGPDGWDRRGVMQFRHPHFFRPQTRMVLEELAPDLWDAVVAEGGVPAIVEGMPPGFSGLACRRETFERALRTAAERVLPVRRGTATDVVVDRGRVTGVVVDGTTVDADLVLWAAGRAAVLPQDDRAPLEGGGCGFSYVSRMYRAKPGVEMPGPFPEGRLHDGYLPIVFPQDDRTISALVVRATDDHGLAAMRHEAAWEAGMRAVPFLDAWTDPERWDPITPVMNGGLLTNTFRSQLREDGTPVAKGLLFVGDSVSTTNPSAGRGVSIGLLQLQALLGMLDGEDVSERFEQWCQDNVRPWYEDHVFWDVSLLRRMAGEDVDVEGPLPSDLVCAAAEQDPSMMDVVGPYQGMMLPPSALAAVEERARAVLRTGWRPPYAEGPNRSELAGLISERSAAEA
jgi:2-polyprenyl-6-methoxyphenol hydroxylase-like FAD-dependent oxidoreductase